ncbi:interleukin-6 receptor subunit beta [Nematolebias whitei]|uniref:interleukin-6 receptor subunit beta n=1 Tax=Nematolebias whitei TaxID=451745 RepID=UPI00189818B5|nr:interleukin-6 receptor subunit beta [Nematolebias whitei]
MVAQLIELPPLIKKVAKLNTSRGGHSGYQGHMGSSVIVGGVDVTGAHLYSVYPHGSYDKLPFLTMENVVHLMTVPQHPVFEIGTNFTATCVITNTTEVTADDLYWNMSKTRVPKEHYTKINSTALAITVPITSEKSEWLFCHSKETSPYVTLNKSRFIHGIWLKTGYRPERPMNLTCVALQENDSISPSIICKWEAVGRQTTEVRTTFTAFVKDILSGETFNASTIQNNVQVTLKLFPNFMPLDVWVEARNLLGAEESEHLTNESTCFVKTNPPAVRAISESVFPTSLLVSWTSPIDEVYIKLKYQIRFCPSGSQIWSYVPPEDTANPTNSFRLQNLRPDTVYVIQMSCKYRKNCGYWSNWSSNETTRTAEGQPSSKPDLWKIVDSGMNEQEVQLISKDPELANGKITSFVMKFKSLKNDSWAVESIPVNSDSRSNTRSIHRLKRISFGGKQFAFVCVAAINSVGASPEACLAIFSKPLDRVPIKDMIVLPHNGQLFVEWKHDAPAVSEYVIEWVSDGKIDWQRENKTTRQTVIKGALEHFICYNVSVYPIYSGWIGKPASKEAFLVQGAPLQGPSINKSSPGYDRVELVWDEIPLPLRRGFIKNYTILYKNEKGTRSVTVPSNTTSHTLKPLVGNTKYDVWIKASTISGSAESARHSFTTLKYAPGMVEGIVVGVSIGFLFLVLVTVVLCLYKKDVIKENFWPQIPNPGESTIGNWTPDYPLKAETPKENCLSGVCVLDEDELKHGFEEDKTSLSLKKDKYLSEEHSSGIGGSSCMSSPRQSVSDSDEGADMADTTASTVQYSSVVASSGYKGQTPNLQPQHSIFSRSESTQPLLDSEENPDMLVQEGGRHFQMRFTHSSENQETTNPHDFKQMELDQQDFCPIEEDTEWTMPSENQSADVEPGSVSSYMPQLNGYRPQ